MDVAKLDAEITVPDIKKQIVKMPCGLTLPKDPEQQLRTQAIQVANKQLAGVLKQNVRVPSDETYYGYNDTRPPYEKVKTFIVDSINNVLNAPEATSDKFDIETNQ